jgi:hypothetical protein
MPYIIAFTIIIVAAGALLLFRQPAEAPTAIQQAPSTTTERVVPEGFTPPTTPPPSDTEPIQNEGSAADIEVDAALEVSTETEVDTTIDSPVNLQAEASYFTPKRTEHDIMVMLELEDEIIVDANVTYDGGSAVTPSHKGFEGAYGQAVIGQNINTIELSRVGGASLTSDAFNDAVADIRVQL